jgi:DNA-binding NarL/FixJ family response regulator
MPRPRLLVVDDDPYTRSALRVLFGRQGWEVASAATVAEGLARLDPAPQCVVLDLDLPDGGGEAVLRAVRAHCPGTRVAVCSAIDEPRRLAGVRDLAPELMLWKPVDLTALFQLCRSARTPYSESSPRTSSRTASGVRNWRL